MPTLDTAWHDWLTENTTRGCSPASMADSMVAAGFDRATANTLAQTYHLQAAPGAAPVAASVTEPYRYDAMPIAEGNTIDVGDRKVQVMARITKPQIIVFGNVLSHDECDKIVARSFSKLKRSTTVNPTTGQEEVIQRRTSEGTSFGLCEDELISRLDTRLARLMNWPMENGEGLQILRYGISGEYRPHFDYFPPHAPGSATHIARGGQRVATLVVYLNDVPAGGETVFPNAGISIAPVKGSAVYFRYFNQWGQVDPLTLHGGNPVVEGEKWIMTKWVRERRYE